MLLGNAFHFVGPKTLKAQDANVFLLVLGTSSNLTCAFDLSPDLLLSFLVSISIRYSGAFWSRH